MASARPQRHNGSLGESWDTAEYPDDDISMLSADSSDSSSSEVGSPSETGSQSSYFEEHGRGVLNDDEGDDMATPMPHPRSQRTSEPQQSTPTKQQTARPSKRPQMARDGSRPHQQSTPQHSPEPAFIMPSINASAHALNSAAATSPMRRSQHRARGSRNDFTYQKYADQNMSPFPRNPRTIAKPPQVPQDEPLELWRLLSIFWGYGVRPLIGYLFDVLKMAFVTLKPLVAFAAIICVLAFAIESGTTFTKNYFNAALAPLCALPLSGYVLPFCAQTSSKNQPNYEEFVHVQASFEDILEANKDSYALPANMKKSQVAMRDLRIQVRFSNLPSKAELENEFDAFIETAREASDGLAKYNARIGYTTDLVISTNKWTLQVLNGIAATEESKGVLSEAASLMNIFAIFHGPSETLEQRIFSQYVEHVGKLKEDISSLIIFGESLVAMLNNLDSRLDIIAEIATRDDNSVQRDRDELLAHLWTKLGGNRSSQAGHAKSLQLLRDVLRYRSNAVQLVSATLLKLREISTGLENLRDGVSAPEVVGYRKDYPLQWHIDVVSRSVQRLQEARGEARAIESEVMRKGVREGSGVTTKVPSLDGREMPTVYARAKYPQA